MGRIVRKRIFCTVRSPYCNCRYQGSSSGHHSAEYSHRQPAALCGSPHARNTFHDQSGKHHSDQHAHLIEYVGIGPEHGTAVIIICNIGSQADVGDEVHAEKRPEQHYHHQVIHSLDTGAGIYGHEQKAGGKGHRHRCGHHEGPALAKSGPGIVGTVADVRPGKGFPEGSCSRYGACHRRRHSRHRRKEQQKIRSRKCVKRIVTDPAYSVAYFIS